MSCDTSLGTSSPPVTRREPVSRRPLTAEQQRLVAEFDRWIPGYVAKSPREIRRLAGSDEVAQDIRLEVIRLAQNYDPTASSGGDIPFRAFAHYTLNRQLRSRLVATYSRKGLWRWRQAAVRSDGTDAVADIPDHRPADTEPVFSAWHDPDFVAQRRRLDWLGRVVLYLRFVELMPPDEVGACLGMTAGEASLVEKNATLDLAHFRGEEVFDGVRTDPAVRREVNRRSDYSKTRRDRKRTAGVCECGGAARPGRTCCEACAEKRRLRTAALVAARREAGLCERVGCSSKRPPDRLYCAACGLNNKTRERLKRDRRKEAGLCPRCGEPSSGRVYCQSCCDGVNANKGGRAKKLAEVAA